MAIAVERGRSVTSAFLRRTHIEYRRLRARTRVLRSDVLEHALAAYEFHPEVSAAGGEVSIWLPELELFGSGDTYAAARRDLLAEVRAYVAEYARRPDLRDAPNRKQQAPFVLRAMVAAIEGELPTVIFAPPVSNLDASAGVAASDLR